MKIVHYLNRFVLADGGVVRAVLDLAAALAARGHEVVVLTHTDTDIPASWRSGQPGAPRLVKLDTPTNPLARLNRASVARAAEALNGADALHLHTPWEPSNPQLAGAARAAGVPHIVSVHGMLDDWCMTQSAAKKRFYWTLTGRKLLETAAVVHCTAQAELEQAHKWFPRGTGRVIPLVFDLEPFANLPGPDAARSRFPTLAGAQLKILFLSRVHPKKGLEVLIDAAAALAQQGVELTLSIVGTGDEAYTQMIRQRAESALGSRAALLGLVTGTDKLSVYQAADLMAIPTSQENFGFVFPEALACRTPVITTKGVDIWPELEASGGAAIVDATPDAFAAAIRRLASDRAALIRMGELGREWVFRELDGGRVVERYEALYADARAKP